LRTFLLIRSEQVSFLSIPQTPILGRGMKVPPC
jgi:hypothetical protein